MSIKNNVEMNAEKCEKQPFREVGLEKVSL